MPAVVLQHLGRGRKGLDTRRAPHRFAQHVELQGCFVLLRNLHERRERKAGFLLEHGQVALHNGGEVDKLEVVKAAAGEVVIELAHHVPGPVAYTHQDDGERVVACVHDGVHCCLLLR